MAQDNSGPSLEVMRMSMPGGEIVRQRLAVIDVAPNYLKNALQEQIRQSEKQQNIAMAHFESRNWPNYPAPTTSPQSTEVTGYVEKLTQQPAAEATNPLMQAQQAVFDAFETTPDQEVNYDI